MIGGAAAAAAVCAQVTAQADSTNSILCSRFSSAYSRLNKIMTAISAENARMRHIKQAQQEANIPALQVEMDQLVEVGTPRYHSPSPSASRAPSGMSLGRLAHQAMSVDVVLLPAMCITGSACNFPSRCSHCPDWTGTLGVKECSYLLPCPAAGDQRPA